MQILVSTMNNSKKMIDEMGIGKTNFVIVNQEKDGSEYCTKLNDNQIWVNSTDKGLSKSRNIALSNSTSAICLISDDDMVYSDDINDVIEKAYDDNPSADIITFMVEGIDKPFKNYSKRKNKIGFIRSLKVASVEISFRRSSIQKNNITFNEDFGSGAKYSMGEENIFLYNCLRKNLEIIFVPIKIGELYVGDSSWFEGFTEKYFNDLGAIYEEMTPVFSPLLILQFALRKYKLYSENVTMFEAIKFLMVGKRNRKMETVNGENDEK